jgi:hypothetical protein
LQKSSEFGAINYGVQLKGASKVNVSDNLFVGWPTASEGSDANEFGADAANADVTFNGNVIVGGQAATVVGSAKFSTINTTNAAAKGYETVFTGAANLKGGFSGFTLANITPTGITAGATAGTDWNYGDGWILLDATTVNY